VRAPRLFTLLLATAVSGALATVQGWAVPVRIQVAGLGDPEVGTPAPLTVKLEPASAASMGAEAAELVEAQVPSDGATVDLPAGTMWRAVVKINGFWAPPAVLTVGAESGQLDLRLLATGRVAGTVRVLQNTSEPASMGVRFETSPEDSAATGDALPRHEVSCALVDRRFDCEVPAGTLDLRLRAQGFVSQYRWSIEIKPGRSTALGTVDLRPGASVVGWVEPPTPKVDFSEAEVRLSSMETSLALSQAALERRDAFQFTGKPNSRGFFSFEGLAPGSYRL